MPWENPFAQSGHWFKGNLHTHTTQSDGLSTPEQAAAWYRQRGYDFVAITDHWYLSRADETCVDQGFLVMGGAELHGPSYHMLALGISMLPDQKLADAPQQLAERIVEQGGLAFMAHPYWTGQTSRDVGDVPGLCGIEVFNSVCHKMDGLGYARVHWDELLAAGAKLNALAVDDVHWKHGAAGRGFVMVRAPKLSEAALLGAIAKGHFYASTGPAISDLRVGSSPSGEPVLQVRCSPCRSITFYASASRGHRFEAPQGGALDGAIYPMTAEQVYLRVECEDALGGIAWSNPVYMDLL
jgi:hypothetical protein